MSDYVLELKHAGELVQREGPDAAAPDLNQPEGANMQDATATPDPNQPVRWKPVVQAGIIVRWERASNGGGSDPPSGATGSAGTAADPPPAPERTKQVDLVLPAQPEEARPKHVQSCFLKTHLHILQIA